MREIEEARWRFSVGLLAFSGCLYDGLDGISSVFALHTANSCDGEMMKNNESGQHGAARIAIRFGKSHLT